MTVPKSVESAPTDGFLYGWVRAIASRFAGSGELQNLGSKAFDQIARDHCPNTPTLQALRDEDRQSRLQASLLMGPSCC